MYCMCQVEKVAKAANWHCLSFPSVTRLTGEELYGMIYGMYVLKGLQHSNTAFMQLTSFVVYSSEVAYYNGAGLVFIDIPGFFFCCYI